MQSLDSVREEACLQVIGRIDAVVISHPDLAHLGALPYLMGRLKLQAPVYATVPCHKMGQMFMYDQYLSRQQSSDFNTFSLDDVDLAFQRMRQLKYQQQVKLNGTIRHSQRCTFSTALTCKIWLLKAEAND